MSISVAKICIVVACSENSPLGVVDALLLEDLCDDGDVELMGLEMTRIKALGEWAAMPTAMSRTMEALICARGAGG